MDFQTQLTETRLIDIRNVITLFGSIDRRRLYEWQKKGYIKKVTNNFYVFSSAEINDSFLKEIANRVYKPSYVGLESALSYYGLIPEAVFQITSVTSRKTHELQSEICTFSYRSIHKNLFWGYGVVSSGGHEFLISDPQKTILDYLYLNPHLDNTAALEELRINKDTATQLFTVSKIRKYLRLFSHKRLTRSTTKLMKVLNVKF